MSDNPPIRLIDRRTRDFACGRIFEAPAGWVAKIGPETRSDQQNRLSWPIVTEIAQQSKHYGRDLQPQDWRNLFMGALNGADLIPSLDGKSVMPLGLSTKVLTKSRFGDFVELMYCYSAEHGIVHRGQRVSL
jgi:hypothetical protein